MRNCIPCDISLVEPSRMGCGNLWNVVSLLVWNGALKRAAQRVFKILLLWPGMGSSVSAGLAMKTTTTEAAAMLAESTFQRSRKRMPEKTRNNDRAPPMITNSMSSGETHPGRVGSGWGGDIDLLKNKTLRYESRAVRGNKVRNRFPPANHCESLPPGQKKTQLRTGSERRPRNRAGAKNHQQQQDVTPKGDVVAVLWPQPRVRCQENARHDVGLEPARDGKERRGCSRENITYMILHDNWCTTPLDYHISLQAGGAYMKTICVQFVQVQVKLPL